ncbi:putative Sensory Transduction Protein Kinase [Candidatus Sulfobium mesophilum]|uniref:histidine kinase n=1 Tax=Candidatus Sulfobium mesophilum TaxID=2016548 RepID=A0A2U3QKG2_9BACT|nr:putative Sensory Transduction Protein Kinase [Candidatus Sulfobium mesophilum]
MFRFATSIQNKVRFGYYFCLVLIIAVSLLNYLNLKRIERKTAFNFIISEFFDATLEMRRFEKNYFLYRGKEDFEENLRFTEKAEEIIRKNLEDIKKLQIKTDVYALQSNIQVYKSLIRKYFEMDRNRSPIEGYELESRIRNTGKKIVDATEAISIAERKYIQSLLTSSMRYLVASIIFLVIVGLVVGQYLSRMVVSPLKQLEEGVQKIIDGKFDSLSIQSSDREIVSLCNAFSRMLKELELRQMRFIMHSEKLACLGTMVSGVAHQLNNPLSNIFSSCQILNEEIEDADIAYKRELMRHIEKEVERAKTMVKSFLEFSRKREFKSKPMPVKGLVEDTIMLVQGDIPANVEVRVDVPDTIWIMADKQRLEQAVLNIIKNAIDAMPEGGMINISSVEDIDNKLVEIRIRDTGMGMDPEVSRKIFDPFFTTKDEGKGSGLGLFVAKEIAEEHEGSISVNSVEGEGTTFIIKLPLKEAICQEE